MTFDSEVWTLTVDGFDSTITTLVLPSEAACFTALRANVDPEGEGSADDGEFIDQVTSKWGYSVYIDSHIVAVTR